MTISTEYKRNGTEGLSDTYVFEIFQEVADNWHLTVDDRCSLIKTNERSYYRWRKRGPRLSGDQRLRAAYVLNIYLDLLGISQTENEANTWVRSPNKAFNGQSPILVMKGSTVDLCGVYTYVHGFAV
jgi:uncharacterized protein (DUF2384 family)